jgi:hypothetical protein
MPSANRRCKVDAGAEGVRREVDARRLGASDERADKKTRQALRAIPAAFISS